jgi:cysteine desulfurase
MHSNNEVGTIQPIDEVVAIAAGIPVHTDAVQSFGKVVFDFKSLGVTSATISAHKLGGPLGVAALILKRGLDITPLLHGGGQERDIRSSTVNAPGIVAFATAVDQSLANLRENYFRISKLAESLRRGIQGAVPTAVVNGFSEERLPGIVNVTFPGTKNESLLVLLDIAGISASQGSAFSAGVQRPSHVLLAMGLSEEEADSTVRFSLGHNSTQEDIDVLCGAIADVVRKATV